MSKELNQDTDVNRLTPEIGTQWEQVLDKSYDGKEYIHLYRHPLPPADVVRDAERLDWLMNSGRIVICDREGCYTYAHTSGRYGPVAKTQREAIDAAMKEMK